MTTTLIANTKGDGKAGDEFWTKAETLLYCALMLASARKTTGGSTEIAN